VYTQRTIYVKDTLRQERIFYSPTVADKTQLIKYHYLMIRFRVTGSVLG